jgi:hypothetical protein
MHGIRVGKCHSESGVAIPPPPPLKAREGRLKRTKARALSQGAGRQRQTHWKYFVPWKERHMASRPQQTGTHRGSLQAAVRDYLDKILHLQAEKTHRLLENPERDRVERRKCRLGGVLVHQDKMGLQESVRQVCQDRIRGPMVVLDRPKHVAVYQGPPVGDESLSRQRVGGADKRTVEHWLGAVQ